MFKKSNNPGQIVYLSSGFVSQNLPLIEKNGYGIMAYNSQQYEISKVDTASGYN
jgi:ABC-type phosphate transport system substrate-binding protein